MKNNSCIKKTVSLLLTAVTIIAAFSLLGCSREGKIVLEYKGYTIDKETYNYWFSSLEEHYLLYYSDIVDSEEYWNKEYTKGETYGEYMNNRIKTQISCYLVAQHLFDEYKLSLSKKTDQKINDAIDDQIEYYGGRSAFNEVLSQYGINISKLKKIYTMEEKFLLLNDYLYNSKTGVEKPTDDEKDAYYKENYARVKYLMVMKKKEYVYDKDGNRVTDANGLYKYNDLTEAQMEEKTAYANSVYEAVLAGKDLSEYLKKDFPELSIPNGFYLTANDYVTHTTDVIDAVFSMKTGDTVLVSNDDAYFIIHRYELLDKAYKNPTDATQFLNFDSDVAGEKFNEKFEELIKEIKADDKTVESFNVATN